MRKRRLSTRGGSCHAVLGVEKERLLKNSTPGLDQYVKSGHQLTCMCMRRFISPHRGSSSDGGSEDSDYLMMHPVYTTEYAESVKPQHKVPEKVRIVSYLDFAPLSLHRHPLRHTSQAIAAINEQHPV